eukprot:12911231-Prorocentrum_lima.AAC.1
MDLKSMNKGSYWAGTTGNIKRAKLDIADAESEDMRSGSWVARTQKKHKLRVLQRAHQLADTFLDLLKE